MSLETLVNGYNAVDQAVLKQYTRLGQHIPEEKLYKVTTGLGYLGFLSPGVYNILSPPYNILAAVAQGFFIGGPDYSLNQRGLRGELPSQQPTDSSQAINPKIQFNQNANRRHRLPVFIAGVVSLGFLGYDIISDVGYDHAVSFMRYLNDSSGTVGFLSLASSMYLKDQDPKLLQKKPSRVKAFLKSLYERAKVRSTPSPVPVPVAGYTVLEENVGTQ